jgi:hypothetical protein
MTLTEDLSHRKPFGVPEWLAALCSHLPKPGEQMVRYSRWYDNVVRGKRHKRTAITYIIESDRVPAAFFRLIVSPCLRIRTRITSQHNRL